MTVMDVAALIRTARYEAALSQRVLAERAGITQHALSRYETGVRTPSIETLRAVLAAAGKQIHAELEPLDADITRVIDEIKRRPVDDRPGVGLWQCFPDLAEVAHRVEGLAAASILGAPVPVETLELSLADELATFDWLAEQMRGWATRIRPPNWGQPRVIRMAAPELRELIASECPTGRFELRYGTTVSTVTLRPPDDVAYHVRVATEAGTIPVQPLHTIEPSDGKVARILAVLRGQRPGSDAAPPSTALRQTQLVRSPRYGPLDDSWF